MRNIAIFQNKNLFPATVGKQKSRLHIIFLLLNKPDASASVSTIIFHQYQKSESEFVLISDQPQNIPVFQNIFSSNFMFFSSSKSLTSSHQPQPVFVYKIMRINGFLNTYPHISLYDYAHSISNDNCHGYDNHISDNSSLIFMPEINATKTTQTQ